MMMTGLSGKHIVLGISGGIAAYKCQSWCAACATGVQKCAW